MNKHLQRAIALMRIALGALFLYAGITKVLDPAWSAAGYLRAAKTFPELFGWFASPGNLGWVNFLNEWGLTLIGVALIFGAYVKWASWAAIGLQALYYLPILDFPYVGERSFIVDEHVIYAIAFLILIYGKAEEYWNLTPKFIRKMTA